MSGANSESVTQYSFFSTMKKQLMNFGTQSNTKNALESP